MRTAVLTLFVAAGCHGAPHADPAPPPPASLPATIALPGAGSDGVALDYLAYDAAHHRVWVPAGGTGKVDVIDATTGKLTPIDGFATKQVERHGHTRTVGPSSAIAGDGVVYVGNRGDQSVCAFDAATLAKGACATLPSMPDGLAYVAATHQLWVTTPRDKTIAVLDGATLAAVATITLDGEPEGFAVDDAGGAVFTNLEDADKTLAIDARSRAVTHTWEPRCGEDGPKGLAFEAATGHLVVVCPSHLETLDTRADGALLGTVELGAGLDAVDFVPARHLVVAAAAGAATISFVTLAPDGKLAVASSAPTVKGARNAVMSSDGSAFVAAGPAGEVLVVHGPTP